MNYSEHFPIKQFSATGMIRCCTLALLLVGACNGYKFLVYSPVFGYSHINFMGAIADALTEAGHNVTMLMPILDFEQIDKTGVKLTKHIIRVPTDERLIDMLQHRANAVSHMWTMQPSLTGLLQMVKNMTTWFTYQCERVLSDDALITQLRDEHFDVGISETFSICGHGVLELANVKTTVSTFAGVYMDSISGIIGEPIEPSYVPGAMSSAGDQMSFVERLKNLFNVILGRKFFGSIFEGEMSSIRKKFPDFKSWEQLIAESSYMMTNANPYLDYPRPMLHKTVPIGGITVSIDPKKNKLSPEWDAILNERNTTVLVSFGSVAKAIYMPDKYKETLLKVFESMPDTTFIMKYEEKGSKMADHLPNVHLSTWFPQNALLADPRLTAFVTHGGLGSTTELAYQGKPAILIPVFADQPRNAVMFAKHGGGIVLTKSDLENPDKLRDTLNEIFNDAKYSQNAKRLSEMLLNQPISPKQLLVRHCEFAARFGRLPNLDPYGRQLSFLQYYLLDVILSALSAVAIVIYIAIRLFRKCFSFSVKAKKD
ncbi:UDP-glucoronosyl and UDP-glucosyl transferase [Oesophagostomum dentatum]|uniref:glucuronosyltransferase n=1 Tax=Oesophagostomum dentatum TaxID=61180 RepID=A0A0B1TKZ1_OESDE|nr:UDP-glucoronosyl and UDP-glucosyl transferase [Oesophagostomum dentatum]